MPHVEDEKAEAGGCKCQRLQPKAMFANPKTDDGQPEEGGSTCRSRQPVNAVAHIDRIDEADNESKCDNQEKRSGEDLDQHFRGGRRSGVAAVWSKPEISLPHPGDGDYQEGSKQLYRQTRRDG